MGPQKNKMFSWSKRSSSSKAVNDLSQLDLDAPEGTGNVVNLAPETTGSRDITREDVARFFLENRSGAETLSAMIEAEVVRKAGTPDGNYLVEAAKRVCARLGIPPGYEAEI